MRRLLLLVLCLAAGVAAAGEGYEEILREASRLQDELRPGDKPDDPLDRAYLRLADAARLSPQRWEAFAMRGANRCMKAVLCRGLLQEIVARLRAQGVPGEEVQAKERDGLAFIEACVAAGEHDFRVMVNNMRKANQLDPDRARFAAAGIKYARGQFEAADGVPGAVDDFRALARKGWQVTLCSEFVARCYLGLGAAAAGRHEFEAAQAHWDEALKWAQDAPTRRTVLSNKAAAYEMDNMFGLSAEILRRQIDEEPTLPVHWKNLGLVLGYQGRMREALVAYGKARALCGRPGAGFTGPLHGNAWLKAAVIHGKLLEVDGDLPTAWRLFLEYRGMLGDDYNFCLNFADFAFHMGQYALAWVFLERARDLQPFCVGPYHLLLQTAMRLAGNDEESGKRVLAARAALKEAQERFVPHDETMDLKRVCGGVSDTGVMTAGPSPLLDPDPLAGFGPDHYPDWIAEAARRREPFRPYDPELDAAAATPAQAPQPAPAPRHASRVWVFAGGCVVLGAVLLLLRRRRTRAAG